MIPKKQRRSLTRNCAKILRWKCEFSRLFIRRLEARELQVTQIPYTMWTVDVSIHMLHIYYICMYVGIFHLKFVRRQCVAPSTFRNIIEYHSIATSNRNNSFLNQNSIDKTISIHCLKRKNASISSYNFSSFELIHSIYLSMNTLFTILLLYTSAKYISCNRSLVFYLA